LVVQPVASRSTDCFPSLKSRVSKFVIVFRIGGKARKKEPLGRPRRRWEDNIKADLREIGWDGVDWIDVAQDRDQWRALVNTVMNHKMLGNS
jgi:hypothetical protein